MSLFIVWLITGVSLFLWALIEEVKICFNLAKEQIALESELKKQTHINYVTQSLKEVFKDKPNKPKSWTIKFPDEKDPRVINLDD